MQKNALKLLFISSFFITLSACGGSDGNEGNTSQTPQEEAIDIIKNFAQLNGNSTAPSLSDYTNAGVDLNGVSLSEINTYISTLDTNDVDTAAEIQAIADNAGVLLVDTDNDSIPDYRDDDDDNDGTLDAAEIANGSNPLINETPIANAGGDQQVNINVAANLNANASSDVDSANLTYAWSMTSSPNGSSSTFSDSAAINPSFTADTVGQYLITLLVSDGNSSATDTLTVTVSNPAVINETPVADAGGDQQTNINVAVNLDASASFDVDSANLTYAWSMTSSPNGSNAIFNDATAINPDFTADVIGQYIIILIVSDGNDSATDTLTVTVSNPNTIKKIISLSATYSGREPWITDGTTAGTTIIKDIYAGIPDSLNIYYPVQIGDTLYFLANDGIHGKELWKSDGTTAGTSMVKDITVGSMSTSINSMAKVGSLLYFAVSSSQLWISDGTEAGTIKIGSLSLGLLGSITDVNGRAFFTGKGQYSGYEVFTSNGIGIQAATDIELPINGSWGDSDPANLISYKNQLFFTAETTDPDDRLNTLTHLWVTGGSDTLSISIGKSSGLKMVVSGGVLYYRYYDENYDEKLRLTDGVFPFDIYNGLFNDTYTSPSRLTDVDGTLFLVVDTVNSGSILAKVSSGYVVLVKDLIVGDASNGYPFIKRLFAIGNRLYFTANTPGFGTELWTSDGTSSGTQMVKDINPGDASSSPRRFVELNGNLLFEATQAGITKYWKTDGTEAGTSVIIGTGLN